MKILVSAYRCSPYDVSEADTSFVWLKILLKKYDVSLFTTTKNEADIRHYFGENFPKNLGIVSFEDKYPLQGNRIIHSAIKVGYFLFNIKLERFLKKNKHWVEEANVLLHRSPMSFRYLTCLSKFNKPFVYGPTGGGLKPPKELEGYFSKENKLLKLRNLDKWLMQQSVFQQQWQKAAYILITLGYVREMFPAAFHHKMHEIIEIGIDCGQYKRSAPPTEKPVSILFVGFLKRYKGAELAIRAFSQLDFSRFPNAQFDIVGGKGEEEDLKLLVKNLGMDNRVIFHGIIQKEKIKEYYEKASIFCFPSLKEANGNVYLEAMSYELPVITADNGGGKFICPDEGSIKIPLNGEEPMIANIKTALEKLLADKNMRENMGRINREHCLALYDWKAMENRIYTFFDQFEGYKPTEAKTPGS